MQELNLDHQNFHPKPPCHKDYCRGTLEGGYRCTPDQSVTTLQYMSSITCVWFELSLAQAVN